MDYITLIKGTELLACKECRYSILPSSIDYHFRRIPHQLSSEIRAEIFQESIKYARLIRDTEALSNLEIPSSLPFFYPELALFDNGLGCQDCSYTIRDITGIKKHYIDTHRWVNPRGKGRIPSTTTLETPWLSGVYCQRFFHSPPAHTYFRVNPNRPYSSRGTSSKRARLTNNEETEEVSETSSINSDVIQGI